MGAYLDYAATAPLSDGMKAYLISILDDWGNPSSLYSIGAESKKLISDARKEVYKFLHAKPNMGDIIFTSGGSASNTLAIKGWTSMRSDTVYYSPIAHKSILNCVKDLPAKVPLKVNQYGKIQLDHLENELKNNSDTSMVVVDYANSELGIIQEVEAIINLAHKYRGKVYLDCTGSITDVPVNLLELDADMIGFSGHKLGALKGVGVLYKKAGITLSPLIYGSQEQGLFGGTENVLGIASLGRAVKDFTYSESKRNNRDYVLRYMMENILDFQLIGPTNMSDRLSHNLYVSFKGVAGETLMILLDGYDIQVSTGSACNSRAADISPALAAIGVDDETARGCIRMTFSGKESKATLDYVCTTLTRCVDMLRKVKRGKG